MTPKLDDKIAATEQKLKQLKTRQRQLDARKRSLAARNQRGQALRRKIVVGAIVLELVETGQIDQGQFRRWLDQGLTRRDDRELFELPVRDSE
jgi:large subunit ribosomal protein L7/L12